MMPDQRSVTDQLKTLLELANKNGLYDAADWLKPHVAKLEVDTYQYQDNDGHEISEPDDDGDYLDRKHTGAIR